MSVKRESVLDSGHCGVRLPGLQAHQISGSIDPRMPTRTLLENALAATQAEDRDDRSSVQASDPAKIRRLNERLAPGDLN